MPKSPEEDLREFLAPLSAVVRKVLEGNFLFASPEEELEFIASQERMLELRPAYERILRRIPSKWNEYCKAHEANWKKTMRYDRGFAVPKGLSGAPAKDALAKEAILLQQRGMRLPQIAAVLNKEHGKDTTTPEAVRKLIKRYLSRTKPNE